MNNGKAKLHWDADRYAYWYFRKIDEIDEAKKDKKKKERLGRQSCPYCFYMRSHLGGAAMTSWECALCTNSQTHGSTCTPTLCRECAVKENRCIECGGNMFDPKDRSVMKS